MEREERAEVAKKVSNTEEKEKRIEKEVNERMVDKVVMRIENCLVEGSYNNKKTKGMAIYEEGGSRENKEKQVEWNNKGYMGTERYGRDVVRKGGNKIMEERVPYIVELPSEEENKEEGIGEKQEVVIGRGDENEEGIVRGIIQLRLKKGCD